MTPVGLDRAGEDCTGLRRVRQPNWVRTATRNGVAALEPGHYSESRIVARVLIYASSEYGGDRILHVARLGVTQKVDPHDFGARTTLHAVSGLALAAQSFREDQGSDVK